MIFINKRTMAEAAVEQIECGFCLRKEGAMESPKSLPCSHIHCSECLTDNYNVNGIVQCPFCREVFDVVLESLPSANVREDKSVYCDDCSKKGVANRPAVTYCTVCTATYCTEHKESHDDVHMDHVKLTIDEYRIQARKLQPRMCSVHKELQYSMGCRSCRTVICKSCCEELGSCKAGGAHELMSIDELVANLTTEIGLMRAELNDKEEEADHMKYKTLEAEFMELRKSVKSSMTTFMEEDVGVKWAELSRHKLQIEAGLKHNHQVVFVNRYEDTRKEIQKLISNELPTLQLQNMVALEVKGQKRELEVEVVAIKSAFISLESGLTTPDPLPTSMTLLQTVQVSDWCYSVDHYQGSTYVGLGSGAVDKIDGSYQSNTSFLTLSGPVEGINVYKDRVYSLVLEDRKYTVYVHDLTGRLLTNWTHTDYTGYDNKLAIVDNQIVIPDSLNKRLSVYSLTGEVIKHLPCSLNSDGNVAMCTAGTNSVVISVYASSQVYKVNISTGDITWENLITKPQAVACYKSRIFVANCSTPARVWILDEKTGEVLTEISDPAVHNYSYFPDIHVSGKTLIVLRSRKKEVLFYELN